jgi:hypothetical protein
MEPTAPAFDISNVVVSADGALAVLPRDMAAFASPSEIMMQPHCDAIRRVQKDFNEFAEGPYRVYHARATEIENFPSTVVAWIREEAERTGLDVHCGYAFCHPCISIRKSLAVGDVMVKCY